MTAVNRRVTRKHDEKMARPRNPGNLERRCCRARAALAELDATNTHSRVLSRLGASAPDPSTLRFTGEIRVMDAGSLFPLECANQDFLLVETVWRFRTLPLRTGLRASWLVRKPGEFEVRSGVMVDAEHPLPLM